MKKQILALVMSLVLFCGAAMPCQADETAAKKESSAAETETKKKESMLYAAGPLEISEVCTANTKHGDYTDGERHDWLELHNISDETISLKEYSVRDGKKKNTFRLPDYQLAPGEYMVVYCDKDFDGTQISSKFILAPFSLSSEGEEAYLLDAEGETIDFAVLEGITVNGSYGREDYRRGWFYYAEPTPGTANTGGARYVSCEPEASVQSGAYDGVEAITVELYDPEGKGKIYYTTGSSAEWEKLTEYTEPIRLTKTTILRAVTMAEDSCRSNVKTFSYFINEGHSFPIISLVGDDFGGFKGFEYSENKFIEYPVTVSLYENGNEVFLKKGAAKLKGFTACTDIYKKNFGVYFKDKYGGTEIRGVDLLETGIMDYASILVRAGQDWWPDGACIRNEFMERLCHEFSPEMPCQSNKYCVLYLNGVYNGIYSLKEDMNSRFYADTRGVSEDSVLSEKGSPDFSSPLYDVLQFCQKSDMSDPENYEKFCEMFDIDNVIDYVILQCYSGNTDIHNNVKFYMSKEDDGKWRYAFYDQDKIFLQNYAAVNVIFRWYAKPLQYLSDMATNLMKNAEYKDKFLRRFAEALQGPLSDENALKIIDELCEELRPEIERDRAHCFTSVSQWEGYVEQFRWFFENGYVANVIHNLGETLELTDKEMETYFGWAEQ